MSCHCVELMQCQRQRMYYEVIVFLKAQVLGKSYKQLPAAQLHDM